MSAATVCVALLLGGGSAADASASPAAGPSQPPTAVPSTLIPLAQYVAADRSGYHLNAPRSVLQRVDRPTLRQLRAYQATVDRYFRAGLLVMSPDGIGRPAADGAGVRPDKTWHSTHPFIETHWYGLEVGLDSYLSNKIAAGLGISAIAAQLAGPEAEPVAVALGLAAGAIIVCQHANGWTYLYWLGGISPFGFLCNPFG